MDYVIVGVITILALLYIIRHVRSMLKGKETGSSCGGCGCGCGGGNTENRCGENPFPVIEGKKTE
ncbi:MAG: hypothetical protein B6240_12650 [Desulfobacteraceae bacterium 4572_87]|nr:MAG: hypothetical protein B6240_12650 [Desulfobacteraceae bacterium 4572_87]